MKTVFQNSKGRFFDKGSIDVKSVLTSRYYLLVSSMDK